MPTVLVERSGGIVRLTLNRPEVRNALSWAVLRELDTALDEITSRDADRVVVLSGAGSAFCGGADLTEATTDAERVERLHAMNAIILRLHNLPKPTIAKVGGPAVGGGWSLALTCDLIVASERAVFSAIFAQRGLSLDMGSSWLLPRMIGPHRARQLAYFGDAVPAAEAATVGLVNVVVPVIELDSYVEGWARRLASGARFALRSNKQLLDASRGTLEEALAAEAAHQAINVSTADADEARRAFREKRTPRFG